MAYANTRAMGFLSRKSKSPYPSKSRERISRSAMSSRRWSSLSREPGTPGRDAEDLPR